MGGGGGAEQAGVARGGGAGLAAGMREPRTRIFSDLHFGDPVGFLERASDFAPLLGDAERVVLNGDSLDTQVPELAVYRGELEEFFAGCGREVWWVTGNHDPDLPAPGERELAGGRVWVTHGDVLFPTIAPWSLHAGELGRRIAAAGTGLEAEERGRVETRLRLNREASRGLAHPRWMFDRGLVARGGRLLRTLLPPGRSLAMLRAWAGTPRLAAELARAQRGRAVLVVLGHTHFPGVWGMKAGRGGRDVMVVNTGSFTRPFGGCFVELAGEEWRVRRIRRGGGGRGRFEAGRVLGEGVLGE